MHVLEQVCINTWWVSSILEGALKGMDKKLMQTLSFGTSTVAGEMNYKYIKYESHRT